MKILRLENIGLKEAVSAAAEVLRKRGVVLYPTDTLYGLGADAFSDQAVAKIYAIKGRDEGKPIHAIVSDVEMAERYGELNDDAKRLIEALPKGKVTFIVPKRESAEGGIARGLSTFGFRIPDNDFCIEMVRAFGSPVTATSANRAGEKPLRSVNVILKQLGEENHSSVLQKTGTEPDLVVDAGELPPNEPSTVVDLSLAGQAGAEPVILREGAVEAADIWNALHKER